MLQLCLIICGVHCTTVSMNIFLCNQGQTIHCHFVSVNFFTVAYFRKGSVHGFPPFLYEEETLVILILVISNSRAVS